MKLHVIVWAGLLLSSAMSAMADKPPVVNDPYLSSPPNKPRDVDYISVHDPDSARFFAVGHLEPTPAGGICTAQLIAGSETPAPDKPALLLTAGHCTTFVGTPNEVTINQPATGTFIPAYFHDNVEQFREYPVVETVYSTHKRTDVAILKLGVTYGELLKHGIKPLTLVRWNSGLRDIELAHGAWGDFLQHSICKVMSQVPVTELVSSTSKTYPFFWTADLATDCPEIAPGSSGSAVYERGTKSVIGVVSTGNVLGLGNCRFGQPCEINNGQRISSPTVIYMAPTDALQDALRPDGSIDVSKLDPGTGVSLEPLGEWSNIPDPARPETTQWNMRVDPAFELIRYKQGVADEVSCSDSAGYGEPVPVVDQPLIKLAIQQRSTPAVYVICVIGKRPASTQWQEPAHATSLLREVNVPVAAAAVPEMPEQHDRSGPRTCGWIRERGSYCIGKPPSSVQTPA